MGKQLFPHQQQQQLGVLLDLSVIAAGKNCILKSLFYPFKADGLTIGGCGNGLDVGCEQTGDGLVCTCDSEMCNDVRPAESQAK